MRSRLRILQNNIAYEVAYVAYEVATTYSTIRYLAIILILRLGSQDPGARN